METFDFSDYPRHCVINGHELFLVRESRWLRRLESRDGKRFHVGSRLLDGSFDSSLFETLDISTLSKREKEEAALAIKSSGRTDLPREWIDFAKSATVFAF